MRLVRIAAVACAAIGEPAAAQRYRVLVGSDDGQRSVVEFRPCIPAEGSACGAWVDREAVADANIQLASNSAATFSPGDSVWIEHGAIRIQGPGKQSKTIADRRGAAQALVLAPMRDYAFVILRAPDAPASTVVMVDLSTRSIIASCPLQARATALAVMR
jgi:hypothetical protein